MDIYLLIATVSLVIQLVVLSLLLASLMFKKKKEYRKHGLLMFTSVILHLVTVAVIMIPSFTAIVFIETGIPLELLTLSVVHGVSGAIALVLGIWIVASWRLRTSLQYCAPKRKVMRATIISWIISIALGIIVYFAFYLPFIIV